MKKINLGFFPTPVHKLEQLSQKFPYELYIKRDDQTGLATGGNKTRKLEYLMSDAVENGANVVVTIGAAESNHCRQTAAAAAKLGLECHLLLREPEPDMYNGNLLLDTLFGAKIHWFKPGDEDIIPMKVIGPLQDCRGKRAYFIPMGGSNDVGLLGYVDAIKELKEQEKQLGFEFDYIVFASSSGGTQAGMILGKKIYNLKAQITGIRIDKKMYKNTSVESHITRIGNNASERFGFGKEITPEDVVLIGGYDEAGYGVVTENEHNTILLMARNEGILLDPVYTGRAFYGMLDLIEKEYFAPGSKILFWHTGGVPALCSYAHKFTDVKDESEHIDLSMFDD